MPHQILSVAQNILEQQPKNTDVEILQDVEMALWTTLQKAVI